MSTMQICFFIVAAAAILVCIENIKLRRRLFDVHKFGFSMYCMLKNLTELDDEALAKEVVRAGIENGVDTEEYLWEIGTWTD